MRFGFAPSEPKSWFLGGEDTGAVWLAFGEILHLASRSEVAAPGRAATPTLPRMLRMTRLTKESSADKIRATLQFCEGLFEDRTASIFPEQIVASLANGIEALARSWQVDGDLRLLAVHRRV